MGAMTLRIVVLSAVLVGAIYPGHGPGGSRRSSPATEQRKRAETDPGPPP